MSQTSTASDRQKISTEAPSSAPARPPAPSFSVVVPTFRRCDQLIACIEGLTHQTLPPAQVIVVVRDEDEVTRGALATYSGPTPTIVGVARPGQTHALNTALEHAVGEVVAFTDDDAVPRPDWLETLGRHYADPHVGGVGGKVIVPRQTAAGSDARLPVGVVSIFGRPCGNHHLGDGPARDVQWLKGVNMSYRRQLCGFDESLLGRGAQVANDSDIALRIHAAGWRVVYDPAAKVDHYAGPRFDEDARGSQTLKAMRDAVFNETFVLLRWLRGWRRPAALGYLLIVGVPRGPGPLGALKAVLSRRRGASGASVDAFHATAARLSAVRRWLTEPATDSTPAPPRDVR
ncbi:MAG: glycosyltransferase [Solirubrobacterales bacterium]